MHKINTEGASVATEVYIQPMDTCPVGVEVLLENPGGVLVRGKWDGKTNSWKGWSPFPRRQKEKPIEHKEYL